MRGASRMRRPINTSRLPTVRASRRSKRRWACRSIPSDFARNVYFDGASAWSEHDWVGSEITLGAAQLQVISPITRCAATQVNPVTAKRDLDIVAALERAFGHINMGVYAEVVAGGVIAVGDALSPGTRL